jgi:triacylglycerol lipase
MPENGMIIGVSWLYRYNMSYIVQQSTLNGKPVLGVSINYRLSAFGFLDSEEVRVCVTGYPNDLE